MSKKKTYLWKFLEDGLTSAHNDFKWQIGKWEKVRGKLEICANGFHASKHIRDAMAYVPGSCLAKVEVKGKSAIQEDKQAWSEMRIVKAYHWTKQDSVAFSIYAAELCLANFEKIYPKDKRPREAIEAAEAWLRSPTEENRAAAYAAYAANAADAAAYAKKGVATQIQRWLVNHVKTLKVYKEKTK